MRIAFGGFHIESSSYNPSLSRVEDFNILRNNDLLQADEFRFLADYDAQFLPTFHARAVPGAPIERDTYETFKTELTERLARFGPVDGVYLALHGAAFVEGLEDAEGDFILAVRQVVGPDCPISASYDLHGNVSQTIIDNLDLFSAYRTAPHIDVQDTMRRAVELLIRRIKTGEATHLCWCPIPVSLPGERTSTLDEPAKGLYARLADIEADPGIWDAALMVGYVWVDEPRLTAAAIITGTDRDAMEAAAQRLAQAYWDAREGFVFGTETGTIEHCIQKAMTSQTWPVVLADSGDNPTAGGAGDRADVLAALLKAGANDVVVAGIADRPATEAAYKAGKGAKLTLEIGATIDTINSRPLPIKTVVIFVLETDDPAERQAVLRIGGIDVVTTARRRPFHDLDDFRKLNIEPLDNKILTVKSGYLSPELAPIANPSLMALSPGIVDQSIEGLPRARTPRPTYPFDTDFTYEPEVFWSVRSKA